MSDWNCEILTKPSNGQESYSPALEQRYLSDTSSKAVNDNSPFFFLCSIDNLASSISDENLYATPRDRPDIIVNNDVKDRKGSDVEDFVKASAVVAAERSANTLWKGDLNFLFSVAKH